jgi:hypothetical protein
MVLVLKLYPVPRRLFFSSGFQVQFLCAADLFVFAADLILVRSMDHRVILSAYAVHANIQCCFCILQPLRVN